MSFLGSIGTSMKRSGLSECLQVVYGSNVVQHIVSGKATATAWRAHFLVQAVLRLQIITSLLQGEILSEEDLSTVKAVHQIFIDADSPPGNMINSEIM